MHALTISLADNAPVTGGGATCTGTSTGGEICDLEDTDGTSECPAGCDFDAGTICGAEDDPDGYTLPKYLISVMPTMAAGIALAIVFPVLCLLWYLLRCCNLMGGRKKHPTFFCPAICSADDDKIDTYKYSKLQVMIFKGVAVLLFLLAFIAGMMAFAGNGLLASGLQGSVDAFLYELGQTVTDFQEIMEEMNAITAGAGGDDSMDNDQTAMMDELKCSIAGMQAAIQEEAPTYFGYRNLATLVVAAIPIFVTLLGVAAAVMNISCLSCCIAAGFLSWLLIIVFISFGLHGLLGVIFGDLCLEMDLSLHYPAGSAVNIPFLPSDMNVCGEGGQFNDLLAEIEEAGQSALLIGADVIKDFCNKAGDFSALSTPIDFTIDCAGAVGAGQLLTGTYPSYTVNSGQPGGLTLGMFTEAKENIMIEDIGISAASQTADCTADAEAYDASTEAGRCPNSDPNGDCIPACGDGSVTISGVSVTLSACDASAMKSLQQCGGRDGSACDYPALQQMSCQIVSGLDQLNQLRDFTELLETRIKPVRGPFRPSAWRLQLTVAALLVSCSRASSSRTSLAACTCRSASTR